LQRHTRGEKRIIATLGVALSVGALGLAGGIGAPITRADAIWQPSNSPLVSPLTPVTAECATLLPAAEHPAAPLADVDLDSWQQAGSNEESLVVGSDADLLLGDASPMLTGRSLGDETVSDRDAVELVLLGRRGFALSSADPFLREKQAGLVASFVAVELVAAVVERNSPVFDLSSNQLRRIATGQVTRWSELGFDGDEVTVLAPRDPAIRERVARAMFRGDSIHPSAVLFDEQRNVLDQLLRVRGAIALVALDRNRTFENNPDVRIVTLDGLAPDVATYRNGAYPYGTPLMLVTPGYMQGAAQDLYQMLLRAPELPDNLRTW
jgi:hypothetical protein